MLEFSNRLIDRAFRNWLPKAWRSQRKATQMEQLDLSTELNDGDISVLRQWIDHCLADEGCQATARSRSAELGGNYLLLNAAGRLRFFELLSSEYGTDETEVQAAVQAWQNSEKDKTHAEHQLRLALTTQRYKLLRHFSSLPSGVKFLVDMRAEVLRLVRKHPQLHALETDLKLLLSTWFDVGLLQLEQITWRSSAEVLEKLIAYEAVHEIKSWRDLKNRLDSDRRCFAFFHPNMPNEPLIFVEVALVNGVTSNVQELLDEDAPVVDIDQANTAIFYSISNAQRGLAGISFGNYLIKQVVTVLQEEFPHLTHFSTLSPIPGLMGWLKQTHPQTWQQLVGMDSSSDKNDLHADIEQVESLSENQKNALLSTALHYLSQEKRGENALDSVAHFHLSNGALLYKLNWLADTSPRGMAQSAGLMVNYLYELDEIADRSLAYARNGQIAISAKLRKLLK